MTKLTVLIAFLAVLALAPAGADAKTFTPITASQFKLTKHGFDKAARQRISQLAGKYPQVGLDRLLADTNRLNTGPRPDLRWGAGPEGLYATNTQLWSLTEARFARTVFGKTFSSLLDE